MRKKNPNKATYKQILENFIAGIIGVVIVIGGIYIVIDYTFFRDKNFTQNNYQDENSILGASDENSSDGIQQIILESSNSNGDSSDLIITSGVKTDKVILFDNTKREYLEGTTVPNSPIEVRIGNFYSATKSNPNGFFSVQIPEDIIPFQVGQIATLDENFQIASSFKFVLVLRQYLGRTYFMIDKRNEFFSLQLEDRYRPSRDQLNETESDYCLASLDPFINSRDFDLVKDNNVIVFPVEIASLDFADNKFVAFRIKNKTETYGMALCKTDWRSFSDSLLWHTEQIDSIFKNINFSELLNPLSSPE